MAEVFAGTAQGSHGFQKPVAIKRLLPELANDHVFVERLIGEAKLLISLQHGNIVSVLDLARDGDDVFLVMEYVDGPSLRQLLKARGNRNLPLGVASYVVQSAAAGLEFAHARPGGAIIHADISPSNLLLTTSGEVRVADFGIARREGGGAGVVEGKWAYMAPEQARGEPLTPRSDVFALGVVLYELVTGQHPLGKQVTADERDSGPIRITPPRMVNPAVSPGLEAICMKALAERATDRYARMQQLIDAIVDERFSAGWREGANDLAQLIREVRPGASSAAAGPRTQVTDRPVTIVTRSLISESAAKRRASSPRLATGSEQMSTPVSVSAATDTDSVEETRQVELPPIRGSVVAIPTSGARTAIVDMQSLRPSTPAMQPMMTAMAAMPAMPAPDAATLEAYRLASAMVPSPELASVHGGHTFTGSSAIDVRDARSMRWTFAVLGIAALVGVIAAIAITLAPGENHGEAKAAPAPAPAELQAPAPAPAAPIVEATATPTVAEPAPVPTAAPQPASETQPSAAVKDAPAPQPTRKTREKTPTRTAAPKVGDRVLRVETYNGVWAWAYVGSQRLDVPGAKFKLAPGTYTVRLKNTDLGVTRTCTVTLGAREVTTLKVDMEEGGCE